MPVLEVPSSPWDTALEPSVVAVLVNAADATNMCALALAHADYLERQADTTWQQADRSLLDEHLSMSDCHLQLAHAASAYGESHQGVLDAVASVDTDDPDHPLEDFDLGTPPNTDIDLRGQGLDRLAVALHSYADRCLWRAVARRVGEKR